MYAAVGAACGMRRLRVNTHVDHGMVYMREMPNLRHHSDRIPGVHTVRVACMHLTRDARDLRDMHEIRDMNNVHDIHDTLATHAALDALRACRRRPLASWPSPCATCAARRRGDPGGLSVTETFCQAPSLVSRYENHRVAVVVITIVIVI